MKFISDRYIDVLQWFNMQSDFFKYATSLHQKLLCEGQCHVKIHKSNRKFRKIYLSNMYLYVLSQQKVKFRLSLLHISSLISSSYSGQFAILTTAASKAVLIDSLNLRQKIKNAVLDQNPEIPTKTVNNVILDSFVQLNALPQSDDEGEQINLLEIRQNYEQMNQTIQQIAFDQMYHPCQVLEKTNTYQLITVIDVRGLTDKALLKAKKKGKGQKKYTVKIYKKKDIKQNQILRDSIMRQRKCLETILTPYIPVLWKSYHSSSAIYCISQYYHAQSLRSYFTNESLSKHAFKNFLGQLIIAIGQIHQCNYVYNAIDFDYVFITQQGYLLLNCFHDCCQVGTDLKKFQDQHLVKNRPPEAKQNATVQWGWDWWALGILLINLREWKKQQEGDVMTWFKDHDFAALLAGLLQQQPSKRLGRKNDYHEILRNQFFHKLSKQSLAERNSEPIKKFFKYELPKAQYQSDGQDWSAHDKYLQDYEYSRELQEY